MGIFRSLNRKFEGDLVADIYSDLSLMHGVKVQLKKVECHAGKGGDHLALEAEFFPGQVIYFHYCGGMGFSLFDWNNGWVEAPWMMALKSVAATRISDFVNELAEVAKNLDESRLDELEGVEAVNIEPEIENYEDFIGSQAEVVPGTYEELINLITWRGFLQFEPYVAVGVGGNAPDEVICFKMLGDDPDYLLIAKATKRLGWDGKWRAWWLSSTPSGKTKVVELAWSFTVQKTLAPDEQVDKITKNLAEFIAEYNDITVEDILGNDEFNVEDLLFTSIEDYSDSYGVDQDSKVISEIISALGGRDFSGDHLSKTMQIEGVSDSPSLTFVIPGEGITAIAIYKRNAKTWNAAHLQVGDDDKPIPKIIPWEMKDSDDVEDLADEISWLTHRLVYGDLKDI